MSFCSVYDYTDYNVNLSPWCWIADGPAIHIVNQVDLTLKTDKLILSKWRIHEFAKGRATLFQLFLNNTKRGLID